MRSTVEADPTHLPALRARDRAAGGHQVERRSLDRDRVDGVLFEQLVGHIRAHGRVGRFYEMAITYYEHAGTLYWTMGAPLSETTIINRCRKEDSYEERARLGTLPPSGTLR